MTLRLTVCATCISSSSEFGATIQELCAAYGARLRLIELDCMAACDDAPAAMLELAYHPSLTAGQLRQEIDHLLG